MWLQKSLHKLFKFFVVKASYYSLSENKSYASAESSPPLRRRGGRGEVLFSSGCVTYFYGNNSMQQIKQIKHALRVLRKRLHTD